MPRALPNWIDSFLELTSKINSPPLLRKWCAISCISATLQQKVWSEETGKTYPNLYIFLVAPPGVGKTWPLSYAAQFYQAVDPDKNEVGASSLTRASLVDHIAATSFGVMNSVEQKTYNTLYMAIEELASVMPEYNNDLVPALIQFWDCSPYRDKKRTGELDKRIPHPQLSLLAGTTPAWISRTLPDAAWDEGFMARTICVYATAKSYMSPFGRRQENKDLKRVMLADLKDMAKLHGEMKWTPDAMAAYDAWGEAGCPPVPDALKMTHYNTRRAHIIIKLMMTASVIRGNDMTLRVDDFRTALDWLIEAEHTTPEIFKQGTATDGRLMVEVHRFVVWGMSKSVEYQKHGVPDSLVFEFLSSRTPAHNVGRIIDVMLRSGTMEKSTNGAVNTFKARALVR